MRRLTVGSGAVHSETADMTRTARDDPVVWLSSVQTNGRPHLVPVWFVWDGHLILAFSKPNARKVDNLRDQPSVIT